jgi:hypothetical protein
LEEIPILNSHIRTIRIPEYSGDKKNGTKSSTAFSAPWFVWFCNVISVVFVSALAEHPSGQVSFFPAFWMYRKNPSSGICQPVSHFYFSNTSVPVHASWTPPYLQ